MTWLASWQGYTALNPVGRPTVRTVPGGCAEFDTEAEAMEYAERIVQEPGHTAVVVWEIDGEAVVA